MTGTQAEGRPGAAVQWVFTQEAGLVGLRCCVRDLLSGAPLYEVSSGRGSYLEPCKKQSKRAVSALVPT